MKRHAEAKLLPQRAFCVCFIDTVQQHTLEKSFLKKEYLRNTLRTFLCYTILIIRGGRAMKQILIVEDDALLNKTDRKSVV